MPLTEIVLGVLAGLVLFLYGVTRLALGMRAVAGERMKRILARGTRTRLGGLACGIATTAILDSSSVTIIMVIALVDAGLIASADSLAVILGANIGTTISSQLLALDVQRYAPVVLAVGLVLLVAGRTVSWRAAGTAVFGLGLVFFGLFLMGDAVEPLRGSARFAQWMTRMESPLVGVLVGGVVTLVLQSSSATVGIVLTLASQGLVTLPAGLAVMLGAEIGTCADTLLATIGRSRAAVRAGVFHLAFNLVSVAVGVALLPLLVRLVTAIGGDPSRQVANAHVAFNVLGAAAMLGFVGPASRVLERLVPERDAAVVSAGSRPIEGEPAPELPVV